MLSANGPSKNLVVIENNLINSLVSNASFQQEFPYLAALVRPQAIRPGCGRCRQKQRAALAEYREFKNSLAAMAPHDKIRFKQFLDCKQVKLVHVNDANRITSRIF